MSLRATWVVPFTILLAAVKVSAADVVISGNVRAARVDGSVVRLEFEDPHTPSAVLIVGWLSGFPAAPDEYYLGKSISARGTLRSFRQSQEVYVRDAADITMLSPVNRSDPAAPPATDEVDKLREQVRGLQRRVQELERRDQDRGGRDE